MQIKPADNRSGDIATLEGLVARDGLLPLKRKEIERELRNLRAGIAGERAAAYEMELYFGRSKNFMTIHDLRFDVGGYVAQIDHLILNRLGEVWICESKHFAEGVSVNDHGEWSMYWQGQPQGIPSPIDQNRRHALLLERVFDDGRVPLPKRFGLAPMKPILRSLVLVSNNARIGRPPRAVAGIDEVIKVEKLEQRVRGALDDAPTIRIARMMGTEGLEKFARGLSALHEPSNVNWTARFGLTRLEGDIPTVEHLSPQVRPLKAANAAATRPRRSGHKCAACGDAVTFAVVRYCWNNSARFAGNVYCMGCQANYPASS
jgi:Nuclease-related domain